MNPEGGEPMKTTKELWAKLCIFSALAALGEGDFVRMKCDRLCTNGLAEEAQE